MTGSTQLPLTSSRGHAYGQHRGSWPYLQLACRTDGVVGTALDLQGVFDVECVTMLSYHHQPLAVARSRAVPHAESAVPSSTQRFLS